MELVQKALKGKLRGSAVPLHRPAIGRAPGARVL